MRTINCKLCNNEFSTNSNSRKYCGKICYLKSYLKRRPPAKNYMYVKKWRERHPHYNRDWKRKKRALMPKKVRIPKSLELNEGNKLWKELVRQEKDWYKKLSTGKS